MIPTYSYNAFPAPGAGAPLPDWPARCKPTDLPEVFMGGLDWESSVREFFCARCGTLYHTRIWYQDDREPEDDGQSLCHRCARRFRLLHERHIREERRRRRWGWALLAGQILGFVALLRALAWLFSTSAPGPILLRLW